MDRKTILVSIALMLVVVPFATAMGQQPEDASARASAEASGVQGASAGDHELVITFSTVYSNVTSASAVPLSAVAGGASFPIPVSIGDIDLDQDRVIPQLRLRYGITDKLDIFAFVSAIADFQRVTFGSDTRSESSFNFNSFGVGLAYEIFEGGVYPSLTVSASTRLVENTDFSAANAFSVSQGTTAQQAIINALLAEDYHLTYLNSLSLSLTSYYKVDPVVFMLQGGVTQNFEGQHDDMQIDLGNVYSLATRALFVVNPFVTFSGGLQFVLIGESEINGEVVSSYRTILAPTLGVSYQVNQNLFTTVKARQIDEGDFSASTVTVGVSYQYE